MIGPDSAEGFYNLTPSIQSLGWWPTGKYQPLTDDIASVAYWYQTLPTGEIKPLPGLDERLAR